MRGLVVMETCAFLLMLGVRTAPTTALCSLGTLGTPESAFCCFLIAASRAARGFSPSAPSTLARGLRGLRSIASAPRLMRWPRGATRIAAASGKRPRRGAMFGSLCSWAVGLRGGRFGARSEALWREMETVLSISAADWPAESLSAARDSAESRAADQAGRGWLSRSPRSGSTGGGGSTPRAPALW